MAIGTKRHSLLDGDDVGSIIWKEAADATARLAITVTEDKEGRVVKQLDNTTLWVLVDYTGPTYVEITAAGAAAVTSVFGETGDVTKAAVDLDNVLNTLHNLVAVTDPGVGDDTVDGYSVTSLWVNTVDNGVWICSDASTGAAVWTEITAAGGGGGGTWGSITGTLSAQTDLQAALDAKADTAHTHDTLANVAADRILGRTTAGSGNSEELTAAATRTLLNVEDGATADQTGAEIKTAYEAEADTNAYDDAAVAKLAAIEAGADVTDATNVNAAGAVMNSDYTPAKSLLVQQSGTGSPSALTVGAETIVGRTTGGASSIAALTATEVRTIINVEDGATADQIGAEIKTAYEAELDTNAFTDSEKTKLAGIETAADVTDTANVTAAGALMDSEVDADLKTLALPANTTISAFGATVVDDADAAAARTTLGAQEASGSGAGAPGVSTGNGKALGYGYVDTTADKAYHLVDATTDANVWETHGAGGGGSVFAIPVTFEVKPIDGSWAGPEQEAGWVGSDATEAAGYGSGAVPTVGNFTAGIVVPVGATLKSYNLWHRVAAGSVDVHMGLYKWTRTSGSATIGTATLVGTKDTTTLTGGALDSTYSYKIGETGLSESLSADDHIGIFYDGQTGTSVTSIFVTGVLYFEVA